MPDPEPRDPSIPESAPDATLRLPVGAPPVPQGTVKMEIPQHLSPQATLKLPLQKPAIDPTQTKAIELYHGDEPPIRLQKMDQPLETAGQTQKSPLQPAAAKPFGWKLPLGLVALVALGAAVYVVVSKRPSQRVATPSSGAGTTGVAEAVPPAAEIYFQQAKTGDAHAMRMLGVMYYYGLNVPKDREKGLYWYRKAAEKGSDAARSELNKLEAGR